MKDSYSVIVVDASVIINLAKSGRMSVLGSIMGYEFVVPDHVVDEITYPDQASALEEAVAYGWLRKEAISDVAEVELYAGLRSRMGKGEAACLAICTHRGWVLASDDRGRAFVRLVERYIGDDRLVDTMAIVDRAVAQGAMSQKEADEVRDTVLS